MINHPNRIKRRNLSGKIDKGFAIRDMLHHVGGNCDEINSRRAASGTYVGLFALFPKSVDSRKVTVAQNFS